MCAAESQRDVSGGAVGAVDVPGPRARRRDPGWLLLLLIAGVAVFVAVAHWTALSARANAFDDVQYLDQNPLVQNPSWESTRRFFVEVLRPSTVGGYYQPLAMTSLMLDVALGGRPDYLRPFHRTSLLLHILNTSLVIVLLYVLFGNAPVAALVGLLFGVHPMTVEVVVWVSERKTLVATFFALWCLITYVWYTRGGWGWYPAVVVALVLALLAKPTTTPLPVLLVLLDAWPLRRLQRVRWKALWEKIPLFVIVGISAIITIVSQKATAGLRMPTEHDLPLQVPLTIAHNIVFYPMKLVWPALLTPHTAFPQPFDLSHPMLQAGVIGTALLLVALAVSLRWTRMFAVGWLFFFIAIFPTMGVFGFTNIIASDKYVYLPVVGFLMVLAALSVQVWGWSATKLGRLRRGGLVVLLLGLAVAGAVRTRGQLHLWQDTETLYRHMIAHAPRAGQLYDGLGVELYAKGERAEARALYERAVELNPANYAALNNLGMALADLGRYDAAKDYFARAIQAARERGAEFPEGLANLGRTLVQLNRADEALPYYQKALAVKPHMPDVHHSLGVYWAMQGDLDKAADAFRTASRLDPTLVPPRIGLARLLAVRGRAAEARMLLEELRQRVPGDPRVAAELQRLQQMTTQPAAEGAVP